MKKHGLFIFIVFIFFACQKEASLELGGEVPIGDTTKTANILTRAVSKVGNDSIAKLYSYDANKRLTSLESIFAINSNVQGSKHSVVRDGNGIIQKLTVSNKSGSTTETTNYTVNYNTTLGRYINKVGLLTITGQTLKDSTVYSYDGSKRLNELEVFFVDPDNGAYLGVTKIQYTYNNNSNINKITTYVYDEDTNGYMLYYTQEYEYDGNINPVQLKHEAILFDEPTLSSSNNVIVQKITSFDDPNDNDLISYTYTYNSDKKPVTGIINSQMTGDLPVTFYYQ